MTRKMMLLVGLLIVAVAVLGTGVGLLVNRPPTLKIPEATPVISAEANWIMGGQKERLFIYEDGSVICLEDTGLRVPSPGHPSKRTWKQGTISEQELAELSDLTAGSEFSKLEPSYLYEGNPRSDLRFTVEVRNGLTYKSVWADSYLSPDQKLTYPDMPYPLNDIYKRLHNIALNETVVVAQETIKN
jgi:hypothetical protein